MNKKMILTFLAWTAIAAGTTIYIAFNHDNLIRSIGLLIALSSIAFMRAARSK